jgi:NADPH-dependent glutamate synthase beta subunit-like oxidoreductase
MTQSSTTHGTHAVAVIGGATAGAEVAANLAGRGAQVAVFEQNPRPYGKIEDGLPRWHLALRRKEYDTISTKLSRPGVHFVPNTRIGRDVDFAELVHEWGFSAVVLANGAWRDRPLAVEGADAYIGRGLIYQNPFIIWFNHSNESSYEGPVFEPIDGAMVVGGGLASIDVVKVLMLETTLAKLRERGIDEDLVEMEVKGIPRTLAKHDLQFEDLGLEGCTLYYRRRIEDMPVTEIPEGATPERTEKALKARDKLMQKAMEKYRFKMVPLSAPDGLLVEGDRLVGLRFRRTRIEGGRVVPLDETYEARGSVVISSIGSIPEPMPGVPLKGELFAFEDWDVGRLPNEPTVFAAGNIVTGKGNIVASRKHATHLCEVMAATWLGLGDGHDAEVELSKAGDEAIRAQAEKVAQAVEQLAPLDDAKLATVLARVRERQDAVGYTSDYATWLESHSPPTPDE